MNKTIVRFSDSRLRLIMLCPLTALAGTVQAELAPEWVSRVPLGTALSRPGRDPCRSRWRVVYHRDFRGRLGKYGYYDQFVCTGWIAALDANLEQHGYKL